MKKALFIITLIIFCIGLGSFAFRTPDNDLWARLIAGRYIFEHFAVLKNDFLSYTPVHPWYDHEWGASVIFYAAFKYFGESGLIMLKGILCAAAVFFCFKTVEIRKPESSHPYNIFYYAFMFWCVLITLGAMIRCLMFTCVFFAVFVYILERYRKKGGKCLLWLPFLMLLWCNIHGGCISGLGLLVIYAAGEFLNKKPVKPYLLTLLACLAALFINPYGIEYVKFLFFAASMDRNFISEWISPFHKGFFSVFIRYKLYLILMLAVQLIYIVKNKITYEKLDKTKILLLLGMAYLSITHTRHIPFFVFTAGTMMYEEFYNVFNAVINKIKPKNEEFNKSFILLKEICTYFILIVLALPVILDSEKKITITETAYPRFAVEFIKINKITGNLFINFDWGSYAAYKLYPDNLIVMDGRYEEVYNPELLLELKNFHLLKNDWYKIIRDYKTDVMLLEKKYPVYNVMLKHPDWVCVFENNKSGVFVPKDKVKDKYLYPVPEDDYYNNSLFDTNIVFPVNNG